MKECRGQLLQRIRQGVASEQDQTAFDAHLSSCENCRMTLDLMSDLDAVGEPEPGDWERVARMADAAVTAFGKTSSVPRRRARRAWQLAVAGVAVAGVAAAGVVVTRATNNSATDANKPSVVDTRLPASSVSAEEKPAPPPQPAEAQNDVAPPAPPAPQELAPTKTPLSASAADVYRTANDSRRAGRTNEAILGYRKLQREFPKSPEAHASRISLGGLLLKTGSASAALAQFDAYLASSGGRLTAEALFGRAQALRTLGRSAEEAQNLERLVTTYPNSAYATHAQRRLRELR